jgi:lipopolysaccharide transport system ATP-binding protein
MSALAIEAFGLSKAYHLGETGWRNLFGTTDEKFWALHDVSFQIREHEAVGIVGANGAGKSTLLKVLSRVTAPTRGRARVRGRMGTILEVGTGFHPELTGGENIYLSGTILGMGKSDIDRRFDEIVAFAGVEKFVDTPVKRYSSGMYVRLAFAVAAHLDPDILVVDEVLAVGDIGFQKKCLAKMDTSIQQEGRTIIFVSHNMQAIRSLCSRALLLKEGQLVADGPVADILQRYASEQSGTLDMRNRALGNRLNRARGHARITNFSIATPGAKDRDSSSFMAGEAMEIRIAYEVLHPIDSLAALVSITPPGRSDVVTNMKPVIRSSPAEPGETGEVTIVIPKLPLRPGEFAITAGLGNHDFSVFEDILDANVSLPHITVEANEDDWLQRTGMFSIEYEVSHIANCPLPTSKTAIS